MRQNMDDNEKRIQLRKEAHSLIDQIGNHLSKLQDVVANATDIATLTLVLNTIEMCNSEAAKILSTPPPGDQGDT
ncbi:predicted protein [Arabidopsis lyrata subsp. lyrata]|uniref:Predicted protein n=1 Tax=Arabidopsis lyrata subsp. lyrata TaxID=81972 RepID=D7MGS2_ARALL|nr:predicted protein [Arabidopsis lyrata subsp. lyrata]